MNKAKVKKLSHGLYKLYWKEGDTSLVSIGSLHDGTRWFAPCNWTSKTEQGIASTNWKPVHSVEPICLI